MNVRRTIKSHSQPSKVVKPSERSLGHPAINAKAASMFLIAASQMGFNAALTKLISMRFGIIGPICIQFSRSTDRVTKLASDRRNAVDQRNQLSNIMAIRTRQRVTQRNPVRVCQNMVLAARFPAIRRIWPGFPPPPTARIDALSTVA